MEMLIVITQDIELQSILSQLGYTHNDIVGGYFFKDLSTFENHSADYERFNNYGLKAYAYYI